MIEISQIIFQLLLLIFLTSFPVNKFLFYENSMIKNVNFIVAISINSLFLMFLLLFFSFFKIQLASILHLILIIYIGLFLKILFTKKKKINVKNWPLILFFLFSLFCIFLNTSYQFELGWDGFSWKEKANFFYNGGYLFDLNKFTRTYQDYPHLGTYIWAFFWKNSFLSYEYIGRLFYDYLYVVSIFSIILSFQNLDNIKKILLFILIFFCTFDKELGGYQDYLVFSILSIFAVALANHHFNKNNFLFYFVYLLAGVLLPWIKVEGTVYSVFLIIVFLIYEFQIIKTKNYLKFLFSIFIILSILTRLIVNNFVFEEGAFFQTNLINFLSSGLSFNAVLTKFFYIIYYTLNSFFKYPLWLLNSIGLILSIYFLKRFNILRIFIIFFILNFLLIFSIYLTTSANIIWYLSASLDRLLLQTSGFYFVIFSLLNYKLIKF